MDPNMNETLQEVVEVVTTYGLNVVGAIVILIIGWTAAGWVARALDRSQCLLLPKPGSRSAPDRRLLLLQLRTSWSPTSVVTPITDIAGGHRNVAC